MRPGLLAAALAIGLAGCSQAATPSVQEGALRYVALGDSYSSGTGTRTYYDSSCQRSVYAYPYLLHNAHTDWTFVHAACSGAKPTSAMRAMPMSC